MARIQPISLKIQQDDIGGSWVLGELAVSPKTRLLTLWGEIKVLEGEGK